MDEDAWESIHVAEQNRLRRKIKSLNHKLERRDRRIAKLTAQVAQLRRRVESLSRPNPLRRSW